MFSPAVAARARSIRTRPWPPFRAALAIAAGLGFGAPLPAQEAAPAEPSSRAEILLKQRQEKQKNLEPYTISKWEQRLLKSEKRPLAQKLFVKGFQGFRAVIGGMPSGSGFVFGAGYLYGLNSDQFQFTANARRSTRGYTTFDALAEFPTRLSDLPIRAHLLAQYQDLTALSFYGLGGDSSRERRSFFQMEDRRLSGGLTYRPGHRFEIGAQAGLLNVNIGSGSRRPSFETVFDPSATPGVGEQPEFWVSGGQVGFNLHDQEFRPAGVSFELGLQRYDGRDSDAHDFTRVSGEIQAHIPLGYRNRIFALRLRSSHSSGDADAEVPFYLMETIGGARTLRGFNEYRFRDRRNLLINAEYRWEVWNYLDFGVFADAGKVFSDSGDFGFSNLQAGYGVGARIHTPTGTTLRFDLARSNEGIKLHISGGPRF
ncbi:MAG TPA: BamA/TamA family outer membrane protein [Acidobacteriota bacterium]